MVRRFRRGYVTLGHARGAAVRLHWTLPLGALLVGGLRWAPWLWAGVAAVLVAHELGHALAVVACRQRLTSLELHGLGGAARFRGANITVGQRAAIAWAGVLAQALLGLVAALVVARAGVHSAAGAQVADALTRGNLVIAAINLLPLPPLDGLEAWGGLALSIAEWRARRRVRALAAGPARVDGLARLDPGVAARVDQIIDNAGRNAVRERRRERARIASRPTGDAQD